MYDDDNNVYCIKVEMRNGSILELDHLSLEDANDQFTQMADAGHKVTMLYGGEECQWTD